ncbi:hypothetical protein C8T65DRAFT_573064 [Cerioporus squamosus]|nr:hypothetical protein C8T65DRAFT_573064 [Cerioporus squamosus]
MRALYLSRILKRFPNFKPRHDFDILAIGRYQGPEKGVYAWLDQQLAWQGASARSAIEAARNMLSAEGVVTGMKPNPGDANVFMRPIPHSPYSLRLFPGSPSLKEYCLDFVETATGQPVNSPFEFELWSTGRSSIPHVCGAARLRSLECSWGYSQKDISPGQEKFVLRDGMKCVLKRPGHSPLRFTVPTRLTNESDSSDADDVDFPRYIA